jgi:hypothetical protein
MYGVVYGVVDSNPIIDYGKTKQLLKTALITYNPLLINTNTVIEVINNQ